MLKQFVFATFLLCSSLIGATEISSQESAYVERLSQTIDQIKEKQDQIWPGYDISLTPIVISFGNGHIYAFNLNSNNAIWKKIQIKSKTVLFATQDLWGVTEVAMQDRFPMEGEEVFAFNVGLMQQNQNQEYLPLLVIVHELFHRYQFNEFIEDRSLVDYKDRLNTENLTLINLEERILIDFLKADDTQKMEHLKNFVAIHKIRTSLMQQHSINWENNQQRMEGLADYVSIKAQDVLGIIPAFSGQEHISSILESYVNSPNVSEFAVKWRHYGVGATLAYGLDYLHAENWKEKIEKNGISLADQLDQKLSMTSVEIYGRAWKVKQQYQFKEIKNDTASRMQSSHDAMTALIDGYKQQKGVVLIVDRPSGVGINGGGNTGGIYHLPDGSTVSVNDSSVSASTDNLWKVEVRQVPYLFQKGNSRWFKVEEDLTIVIDGQDFSMQELMKNGQKKHFERISWKGTSCDFESVDRTGHIEFQNGTLKIVL